MLASGETTPRRQIWKYRRTLLSTLWVFLLLNFIYADIFSLMFDPTVQEQAADFSEFALLFAVLMETAIAMVLLSRILPYRWNRWTNIAIAVLHIAVLVWTLIDSPATSFYAFFVAIEIAALLFVIGYAWTWRRHAEAEPATAGGNTAVRPRGAGGGRVAAPRSDRVGL